MLCSLFLIFCVAWPGAYAVEMPDLDDLGIDPWGDLGIIQDTPEPVPSSLIQESVSLAPVDLEPAGEEGIALTSISDDIGVYFRIWQTSPSLSNASNSYYVFSDQRYLVSSGAASGSAANRLRQSQYEVAFVDSAASPIIMPSMASSPSAPVIGYMAYGAITRPATTAYDYEGKSNSPYGTVVHFSDLGFDKYDGSILAVYGYFISDLKVGHTYVKDSSTLYSLYGSSPTAIDISWSLDGETFSSLPDGSTYDFSTGLLSLEVPIDSIVTDFYLSLSFSASTYYASNTSIISKDTGILFYKLDVSELNIKAVASQQGGVDAETKGLLGTIISWLTSIRDGIVGVATSIAELPGKIVIALIDGLKGLFVPSEEDLAGIKDNYTQLLEERLGFVWQAGEMVISFGQSVLSAFENSSDFQFEFPGISFELPELGQVTLIEAQAVSVNNAFMDVMQPVLGTIVSFICVLSFINTCERMVVAWISGVSYFHFLKGE